MDGVSCNDPDENELDFSYDIPSLNAGKACPLDGMTAPDMNPSDAPDWNWRLELNW